MNAVSFQITFEDNVIHHPTCHLDHLYCCAVSCPVSLSQLPVGIQASLQVPFCLPFPGHSNTVSPTQLSACSHQHVTAVVARAAFVSGILVASPADSFNYLSFPHPPWEMNYLKTLWFTNSRSFTVYVLNLRLCETRSVPGRYCFPPGCYQASHCCLNWWSWNSSVKTLKRWFFEKPRKS